MPEIRYGRLEGVTDELCVEFYECFDCRFQRVPKMLRNAGMSLDASDELVMTAKYCPGCGQWIRWVNAEGLE